MRNRLIELKLKCNYKYEIYNMKNMRKIDTIISNYPLTTQEKKEQKKLYDHPIKILLVSHEEGNIKISVSEVVKNACENNLKTIFDIPEGEKDE